MDEVIFRTYLPADEQEVFRLIHEINDKNHVPGFNWDQKKLIGEFNHSQCYVLTINKVIHAFISVRALAEADEIMCIAVTCSHQGQGFGQQILSKYIMALKSLRPADNAASRKRELWLEVHEKNHIAIKFYTQFGFIVVGRRNNYYSDGGGALLLSLEI